MQKDPDHRTFANVPVMWEPDEKSGQKMKEFMKHVQMKYKVEIKDYWDLHEWSIRNLPQFWEEMWELSGIIHSKMYEEVVDMSVPMQESTEWFRGAKINFAENLLKYKDDHVAIYAAGEDRETRTITYAELNEEAKVYAAALRKFGIKKGDRVACFMSNREEAVFAMLGATSIGALWLGALPLMGAQAVLNRLKQVEPRILFTIDRFSHDRQEKDMLVKLKDIAEGLPSLEKVVILPSKEESKQKDISYIKNSCFLPDFLELAKDKDGAVPEMVFEQLPFNYPIFISYTSGTTGLPKALIHNSGGLMSTTRDFWLHSSSDRNSVWLSMSPVGWASWNMLSIMHFLGAGVVLFEGLPYFLSPTFLWDMVDKYGITNLFLTPSVLDDLQKKGYLPSDENHLTSLKRIFSGGSVVKTQNFDFVYKQIKPDIIFASAYGCTELMGAAIVLEQTLKIHRGEIPAPSLGIAIECLDDSGKALIGETGELVVSLPTPSLPVGLWGDHDGSLFKKTYLEKFPGKFALGDLAYINPVTRGIVVRGRSDDTLKPRGCRFGSSEIYNIVDTFPEVLDSLCVSQYNKNLDERAVLFLKMRNGHRFDENLVDRIRAAISRELSYRHVPEVILETPEIPHNLNGKKMEIIVKKIINNMAYNPETVSNPECLENFKNLDELRGF